MENYQSPFTPTFGTSPMTPVGRREIINEFRSALQSGPGMPGRAMLLAGTRGVGKTVLLNELEGTAKESGWRVIEESALSGLVERLENQHLPRLLQSVVESPTKRNITGVNAFGLGGITTQVQDKYEFRPGLRHLITDALEELTTHDSGLLLTIDEITTATVGELATVVAVIQHMFRERRNVALALAGLPEEIEKLLQHPGVTFIRRAMRFDLGAVTYDEAKTGLLAPVESNGCSWQEVALDRAVAATRGFPFLIQLVGFHSWTKMLEHGTKTLGKKEVDWGIERANANLVNLVIEPVLRPLPALEREFLQAMAESSRPARTSEIANRLGKGSDTVSHYARKLMGKHIIFVPRKGHYEFAIPGMRDYFRAGNATYSGPNFW